MNFPLTVTDLIHWDTYRERDTFGAFTVITGFEGTGHCFWCGDKLEGRRRYCGNRTGCWARYQEHFAFRLQVKFPLQGGNSWTADAVYLDDKLNVHVVDAKSPGTITKEYRIKKKLFKERYGKEIEEL